MDLDCSYRSRHSRGEVVYNTLYLCLLWQIVGAIQMCFGLKPVESVMMTMKAIIISCVIQRGDVANQRHHALVHLNLVIDT